MFWDKKKPANTKFTSKETIVNQINEPRPLPMNSDEFHIWAKRIISGALVPRATVESQKWVLANLLLHVDSTQSFKPDAFFIHSLRKNAVNETAIFVRDQIHKEQKARKEKEEQERKLHLVEAPILNPGVVEPQPTVKDGSQVLADKGV